MAEAVAFAPTDPNANTSASVANVTGHTGPVTIPSFQQASAAGTATSAPVAREERPINIPTQSAQSQQQPLSTNVTKAIEFLQNPNVKAAPVTKRVAFLEKKGLTKDEISTAFRLTQSGDPYPSGTTTAAVTSAVPQVAAPVQQVATAPTLPGGQVAAPSYPMQPQQAAQAPPQYMNQQMVAQPGHVVPYGKPPVGPYPTPGYHGALTANPQQMYMAERGQESDRTSTWKSVAMTTGGILAVGGAAAYAYNKWILPYWSNVSAKSDAAGAGEEKGVTKGDLDALKKELTSSMVQTVRDVIGSNQSIEMSSLRSELSAIRDSQQQLSRQLLSGDHSSLGSLVTGQVTTGSPVTASPGRAYVESLGISPVHSAGASGTPMSTPGQSTSIDPYPWKKAIAQATQQQTALAQSHRSSINTSRAGDHGAAGSEVTPTARTVGAGANDPAETAVAASPAPPAATTASPAANGIPAWQQAARSQTSVNTSTGQASPAGASNATTAPPTGVTAQTDAPAGPAGTTVAGGSGEPIPQAPHSSNFMDIVKMVSEGKTPPDVQTISEQPTNIVNTSQSGPAPPKPWERAAATGSFHDILNAQQQQQQQQHDAGPAGTSHTQAQAAASRPHGKAPIVDEPAATPTIEEIQE